jgi:mannitol-1-phosphate 5-dehydrogenase
MVPLQENNNFLKVISEENNDVIVDKHGFIGPIPTSKYIVPVTPIKAYVERKLYIHNLGHASCAYIGSYYNQQATYINEVLADPSLFAKVKKVMSQSMMIVAACYPVTFSKLELQHHVDDLLFRFTNPSLGDTLYRVGRDLKRKLHYRDRIMGAIIRAQSLALSWSEIASVYIYALEFVGKDENGNNNKDDSEFMASLVHLSFKEKVRKASSLCDSSLSKETISTILDGMELIYQNMYANRKHT